MTDVTIHPTSKLQGQVSAPPSKAYTQRMVIAASLAQGTSKILNPLISNDSEATLCAVTALGAKVVQTDNCWTITGSVPKNVRKRIDCGDSGATLRFMIPVAALASGPSVFVLGSGLANRPVQPLLDSLTKLGAQTSIKKARTSTTVQVDGGGLRGGKTSMPGDVSSQFVSGLMFACPLAKADTQLTLTSLLESKSYVLMTENVLAKRGVDVTISEDFNHIKIPGQQTYNPLDCKVPGDFSSAAFLLATAALTESKVSVRNLDYGSIQGDKAIVRILKEMGVTCRVGDEQIEVEGTGGMLQATDVDARDIPDLVPVLSALACYADGTTCIHDAERLRLKESDRLNSLFLELRKMGADIDMDEGSLTIKGPANLHGAVIDSHSDHRIAMACSVAALRAEGDTVIQDAQCIRKSYPQFFTDVAMLGANVDGGKLDR